MHHYRMRFRVVSARTISSFIQSKDCSFLLNFPKIQQGANIFIDVSNNKKSKINVSSAWQNHSTLSTSDVELFDIDETDGNLIIKSKITTDRIELNLIVPEIINIYLKANELNMATKNKV